MMKKTTLALAMAAVCMSGSALAHQAGSVVVRGGPILVVPDVSNTTNIFPHKLDVNSNAQLGLTGTYMITDHIGIELLAATPFSHEITIASGPLNGAVAGKTKHLPPSLYLQYYFLDKDAKARPYLGAGVNYTTFFSEEGKSGVTNLKLKDSWGPVVNAGVDIKIADNVFLNTSIWYAKIKTKASFEFRGDQYKTDVKLDPMVYFIGLGYQF